MTTTEARRHRFQRWLEGKVICSCGWESTASFSTALTELAKHLASVMPPLVPRAPEN